jgi:GGDEF domain-containing protein
MRIINDKLGKDLTDLVLHEVHQFFAEILTSKSVYYCREHKTEGDEWIFIFFGNLDEVKAYF